ncbi:uncharacterized protein PV09_06320 [Verruconis gallopava]|uniref:Fungal lipase-type domain-containing protein n=1 Tax=Verruconis gallopava TaxID=253628 RepID=A0A0D1YPH3_9PEZI|nr:uncharacterized protein PV09_06320 [Verruconis gallopava]KIW02522.1 hypothetical protein PV09_06320 [Verruconis gallopava]
MTFFNFSHSSGNRKPKSDRPRHSAPPPHPANGYGYSRNASSTTLHRPIPPPVAAVGYQPPPAQSWRFPPAQNPAAIASQPAIRVTPPYAGSPPAHPVYGPMMTNHPQAWKSTASVGNNVYPSHGSKSSKSKSSLNLSSMVNDPIHAATASVTTLVDVWDDIMDSSGHLYDRMSMNLDRVITCMDEEKFSGNEKDLDLLPATTNTSRSSKQSLATTTSKANHFSKVWEYSNSRLPPYLPPVKLYLDTWPLISLAAKYSLSVYEKAKDSEKNDHIKGNYHLGTKAMVLKSLPVDDRNTIVFAIRGTSTFMDWTVNMKQEPVSPAGFLDDPDNFCHAGFLHVAKAMVQPVAARLRTLLEEDPSRGLASLLITGHSAGGAVAQLLYSHIVSELVESELTFLMSFFKRVHCITFGAPPVSLFPLEAPKGKRHRKSLFFALANEGDPVVRADKAIVKSLLKLYAVPAPSDPCKVICPIVNAVAPGLVPPRIKKMKSKQNLKASSEVTMYPPWKVPASTLSLGGRILLMRPRYGGTGHEDLELCGVTDEMLRDVIYGDPMAHAMKLYARRVELLATKAATGGGFG